MPSAIPLSLLAVAAADRYCWVMTAQTIGEENPPKWLEDAVEIVHDFPKPGIVFRDFGPLWRSSADTSRCAVALAQGLSDVDLVVGIEARGFLAGIIVAQRLGVGFVAARKPGKLAGEVTSVDYSLEYGRDSLEIQAAAICEGERVLIVDDVIATGGTAAAAVELVKQAGGTVVGVRAIIELAALKGSARIAAAGLAAEQIEALWVVEE